MKNKWLVIYYDTLKGDCPVMDFIVLTHVFNKNTNRVPKSEIKKAKNYREDFLKRFNEDQIREEQNENI